MNNFTLNNIYKARSHNQITSFLLQVRVSRG